MPLMALATIGFRVYAFDGLGYNWGLGFMPLMALATIGV